jgi:signal transduction histidine kinase
MYFVSSTFFLNGFIQVEKDDTSKNVERVNDAISDDINQINLVCKDYAGWDDTYQFINDANENYINVNLLNSTFTNLNLNIMLFFNSSGGLVFGNAYNLSNEAEIPIPASLRNLSHDDLLLKHNDKESSYQGIFKLSEGFVLLSSQPILKSDRTGPVMGTLIFGRYLDEHEINRLSEITHLSLKVHHIDEPDTPFKLSGQGSFSGPIIVRALNEDSISGYTMLKDVYGDPALFMEVSLPRTIYNQAKSSIYHLLVSLIAIGIIFSGMFFLLFEKLVLSRLAHLNTDVNNIEVNAAFSGRVKTDKNGDELTKLGGSINNMLEALERAQVKLQNVEKELRENRDQLVYVSKAKSEFLATMSHELRTPLNSIMGFSELLNQGIYGKLNEKQEHFVNNVLTSSKFLLDLINDILDLSKVEAGKFELVKGNMSVQVTIGETLTLIKEKALKHNILLKQEIDPQIDFIEADKQRFKQILFNLLSNAVKFSKKEGGTVTIKAKKEGDLAMFSVSDTGVGIKEEDMGKLFTEFAQANPEISKDYGGTGLGLAISKKLVELHGGTISVESRYGEGSTFTFTLPLKIKEETA